MACCRGKEKEAAVFDLVKKEDVEDQMRFFYEALTPLTFMMFRVNMVVNRVLQEPVEALKGLEQDELVKGVLGEELCKCYIAAKKQEWEAYSAEVSQWETKQYLYRF